MMASAFRTQRHCETTSIFSWGDSRFSGSVSNMVFSLSRNDSQPTPMTGHRSLHRVPASLRHCPSTPSPRKALRQAAILSSRRCRLTISTTAQSPLHFRDRAAAKDGHTIGRLSLHPSQTPLRRSPSHVLFSPMRTAFCGLPRGWTGWVPWPRLAIC
jgi:hypothetical protein